MKINIQLDIEKIFNMGDFDYADAIGVHKEAIVKLIKDDINNCVDDFILNLFGDTDKNIIKKLQVDILENE